MSKDKKSIWTTPLTPSRLTAEGLMKAETDEILRYMYLFFRSGLDSTLGENANVAYGKGSYSGKGSANGLFDEIIKEAPIDVKSFLNFDLDENLIKDVFSESTNIPKTPKNAEELFALYTQLTQMKSPLNINRTQDLKKLKKIDTLLTQLSTVRTLYDILKIRVLSGLGNVENASGFPFSSNRIDTLSKDMLMVVLSPISLAARSAINIGTGLIIASTGIIRGLAGYPQEKQRFLFGASQTILGVGLLILAAVAPITRICNLMQRTYVTCLNKQVEVQSKPLENNPFFSTKQELEDFVRLLATGSVEASEKLHSMINEEYLSVEAKFSGMEGQSKNRLRVEEDIINVDNGLKKR